jgi:hypothetical protein
LEHRHKAQNAQNDPGKERGVRISLVHSHDVTQVVDISIAQSAPILPKCCHLPEPDFTGFSAIFVDISLPMLAENHFR